MDHSQTIIHDLTIVVVCAAIVSVVFNKFNLPVILGYLLSGVLIGPNVFYDSPILNIGSIDEMSELGVIFLMFYIGMEFDLSKLKKTIGPAFFAVVLQTVTMIVLGLMTASMLGWSNINGLFIGGVLSISSTMITFSVLKGQNELKHTHAQLAIGMLILEDIVAILLLVILSGVAVTGHFKWENVGSASFLVGVFVVMVFFIGKLSIPYLVKFLHKLNSQELILMVTVGMVLGIGTLAHALHFSMALGAFLAGAILSGSSLAEEIEQMTQPFMDLFAAIFFVTVGMLIEPSIIIDSWVLILALSFLVIVGKILTVVFGLFVSGQNPKSAIRAALCKAQIGEFSFIIVGLGQAYKVTESDLGAIAVGVALVTILATPILNAKSQGVYNTLVKVTPQGLKNVGRFYYTLLSNAKERLGKSTFLLLIRRPILQILGYFLLFNGIILLASLTSTYVVQFDGIEMYHTYIRIGIWVLAGIISLPFLTAVIRNLDAILMLITEATFNATTFKMYLRGRIRNLFHSFLLCAVLVFFGGIYLSASASFFPTGVALTIFISLVIGASLFFWKNIITINSRLENLFIRSLEQQPHENERDKQMAIRQISAKYPWPIHIKEVQIKRNSFACGKRIIDLDIRKKTGASIISLTRGDYTLYDPEPVTTLFPGDELLLIGEVEQSRNAELYLDKQIAVEDDGSSKVGFQMEKLLLTTQSKLVGETLAGANLRQTYKINIVGIQRGEHKITSPQADEILQVGDILLLVGKSTAIENFKNDISES